MRPQNKPQQIQTIGIVQVILLQLNEKSEIKNNFKNPVFGNLKYF